MTSIRSWLETLGLDTYADAFDVNAVTWDTLPDLDHELLKEIGVGAVGHRIKILKAIQSLEAPPEPSSPAPLEQVSEDDFDDVDGYLAYRDHPDHQALIAAHITGRVADRAAVQYGVA